MKNPKVAPKPEGGLSAYEKAGLEGKDPRCIPIKLKAPMPVGTDIPYPDYTDEEHETWQLLFKRQQEVLQTRACQEYLKGLALMEFPADRIPALSHAHQALQQTTGWGIARAPGLLYEKDFFHYLSRRIFPATDYIRPRSELDYTPAPDLFHDVFGHTPMITLPEFADFYQKFGEASMNAEGETRRQLERIYWFTVEFGLIRQNGGYRIYGNGILSSYGETLHCLTDKVEKRPFIPEQVAGQEYDVWHMQPLLFYIESFVQLEEQFTGWARAKHLLD